MAVRKIDVSGNAPTGYAEGKAIEHVNWDTINTQFQEQMQQIETDREAQRNEIDANSREIMTTLDNSPLGNHAGRNEALLEYADNAKQAMLMLDKNLKNGNISLKDYTIAVQNLKDGTSNVFSVMEDWNTDYEAAMNRMQNCGKPDANGNMIDCSSAQEQYQMMQAESLGKLENHALYINPSNFKVSLGKRLTNEQGQLTGGISQNQNDFAEVQQLRNRVKQKINKYDLEGNLDNIENQLSTEYQVALRNGKINSVKDARENPAFKGAIENWINSMMTNDVDIGSMLTDYLKFDPHSEGGNTQYTFTMDADEAEADGSKILLIPDPERPNSGYLVPDFSTENGKKQEQAAYDLINMQIEGQLDRLETVQTPVKQTKTDIDVANKGKAADAFVTNLSRIWTGDDDEVNAALSTIEGSNPDIKSIKVVGDEVIITKYDSKLDKVITLDPIPRGDNQRVFLESIIMHVKGDNEVADLSTSINRMIDTDATKGEGEGEREREVEDVIEDFNTTEREGTEKNTTERPSDSLIEVEDLDYYTEDNAPVITDSIEEILSFLPDTKSSNGYTTTTNEDITYTNADGEEVTLKAKQGYYDKGGMVTIYYPELMTAPINIPTYANSDEEKEALANMYNTIVRSIFNSAKTGKKVKPNQFKNLFTGTEWYGNWDNYNNAELFIQMGLLESAEQWSDGDGIYEPGSSQLTTKKNKGDFDKFNK